MLSVCKPGANLNNIINLTDLKKNQNAPATLARLYKFTVVGKAQKHNKFKIRVRISFSDQ